MNEESFQNTRNKGKRGFGLVLAKSYGTRAVMSGNVQACGGWPLDCDGDTLLIQVKPEGPHVTQGASAVSLMM